MCVFIRFCFTLGHHQILSAINLGLGVVPDSRARSLNIPNDGRDIPTYTSRKLLQQSLFVENSRNTLELQEPITVDFTTAILWPEGSSTNDVCAFGNLAEV